jgi:hypothetical protein
MNNKAAFLLGCVTTFVLIYIGLLIVTIMGAV